MLSYLHGPKEALESSSVSIGKLLNQIMSQKICITGWTSFLDISKEGRWVCVSSCLLYSCPSMTIISYNF